MEFNRGNPRSGEMVDEQQLVIREETRELAKQQNHIYNAMIHVCQKKCLSFDSNKFNQEEIKCLKKCIDQQMFLDNMIFEFDSAMQIASTEGRPKKANFYYSRRIEDLTS